MKGIFKIKKIIFPKGVTSLETGEFAIVSCDLVRAIDGTFKINKYGSYSFKGILPVFNMYEDKDVEITIMANETKDEKYPNSYNIVTAYTDYKIDTEVGKRVFLSKLLTEKQLESLYAEFEDPLAVIASGDIDKLVKVKGIKLKKARGLIEKYDRNKDMSEIHVRLNEFGINLTSNMINKLLFKYKTIDNVIKKITDNPYILAHEIDGVGFIRADMIALEMGYPKFGIYRATAFIEYFLLDRAENGYSWVKPDDLYTNMVSTLGNLPDILFSDTLKVLKVAEIITWNEDKSYIALQYYYDLEKKISNHLLRIKNSKSFKYNQGDKELITKKLEEGQGWEFTDEQILALDTALEQNLCIITGGGGCGKTSSVEIMLKVLESHTFAQTALSGKASSRLQEVTGEEGHTIHRLLSFNPLDGSFLHNEENPLPYDIIVLDEGSMVGGEIFLSLVSAVKSGKKLVILGDEGQLESIGSLNVFKDMLDSKSIPVVKLNKIHRQAQKSAIATDSIKVRNQELFLKKGWVGREVRGEMQDLVLDIYDDKLFTSLKIMESYKQAYENYKDSKDITIVVPLRYSGESSAYNINIEVQEFVNPSSVYRNEIVVNNRMDGVEFPITFRDGDRVLAKKNNRETVNDSGEVIPISNGFLGTIKEIRDTSMLVDFDIVGEVVIESKYYLNLLLGYAITGHSMQGSENKCIIVGLDYSGFVILSKEWVYTAMTRASKICYIVAETKALSHALATSKVPNKQTFLRYFLDNEVL